MSAQPVGERASRQLVHQRIRNRLIEYFELLSSEADLLDYEASVPINLFAEIINQWEDWLAEPTNYAQITVTVLDCTPLLRQSNRGQLLVTSAIVNPAKAGDSWFRILRSRRISLS